jgi:hypothetical protein
MSHDKLIKIKNIKKLRSGEGWRRSLEFRCKHKHCEYNCHTSLLHPELSLVRNWRVVDGYKNRKI